MDSNGDCDISQRVHSCEVEESNTRDCDSSRHAHTYTARDSSTRPQDPEEAAAEDAVAGGEGTREEALPAVPLSVGSERSVSHISKL